MIPATQLRRRASALKPYSRRFLAAAGYAAFALVFAATIVRLVGPAAAATAAMAVAIFTLAVAFHVLLKRRASPVIAPQRAGDSVDAGFDAAADTDGDSLADTVGAEILSAIEQARDEAFADRSVSPAVTAGAAGKCVTDERGGRWAPLSAAARMVGQDRQAVYRAAREGHIRWRLARGGGWLVDLGDVRRLASGQTSSSPAPVLATDRSEALRVERLIVEAMTAGRVEMELTTVATLPARKSGMIDGHLVLGDASGRPIDVPTSLSDEVRQQLDLLAVAFAGATLRQRSAAGRSMFVHLAAASVKDAGFRSELEAAFDDEPSLPPRLVIVLPLKAYADLHIGAAVDDLMTQGLRFAADARNLPVPVASAALASCPPVSFVQLSADALVDAPEAAAAIAVQSLALMATGVATEKQVVELLDLGLQLAAGPLFAMPKRAPVHLPMPPLAA